MRRDNDLLRYALRGEEKRFIWMFLTALSITFASFAFLDILDPIDVSNVVDYITRRNLFDSFDYTKD